MNKKIEDMTYEEFYEYCEERTCDGQWSIYEAVAYIDIINKMNNIKIKTLFWTNRKKTKEAREKAWQQLKIDLLKKEG